MSCCKEKNENIEQENGMGQLGLRRIGSAMFNSVIEWIMICNMSSN